MNVSNFNMEREMSYFLDDSSDTTPLPYFDSTLQEEDKNDVQKENHSKKNNPANNNVNDSTIEKVLKDVEFSPSNINNKGNGNHYKDNTRTYDNNRIDIPDLRFINRTGKVESDICGIKDEMKTMKEEIIKEIKEEMKTMKEEIKEEMKTMREENNETHRKMYSLIERIERIVTCLLQKSQNKGKKKEEKGFHFEDEDEESELIQI